MDVQTRVEKAWKRIFTALERVEVGGSAKLGAGATPEAIDDLEKALGFELPADVRASLVVHSDSADDVFDGHPLLTPEKILVAYREEREDPWPRYRVPLAGGQGGWFAVDVASAGAPEERVVYIWRSNDLEHDSTCWAEHLEREADALEAPSMELDASGPVSRAPVEGAPSAPISSSGLEVEPRLRSLTEPPDIVDAIPPSATGLELERSFRFISQAPDPPDGADVDDDDGDSNAPA